MKILTVVGARPQFIKAQPTALALRAAGHEEIVVHTGQHYDPALSDRFFAELGLPAPHVNLGLGSGPHGEQTGRMLAALERELLAHRPDWVLVYGDTNSTLAGALAAAKLHVPVAHVEAGLRSFDRRMPEEINRVLTDHVSARLFCPTAGAAENLAREGIVAGVEIVGDVMLDALRHFAPLAATRSRILVTLGLAPRGYRLATIHRAENTNDAARLRAVLATLAALDRPTVLPLHPRTRALLAASGGLSESATLRLIEPVGYLDMLTLTRHADAVLTDSGGLQKEAYWLGTRCLTLRENTEWTETLAGNWNQLTGTDSARIRAALATHPTGQPVAPAAESAADRIARSLATHG
jgi:UDP-N-acetylglucosamine 2-epimerase